MAIDQSKNCPKHGIMMRQLGGSLICPSCMEEKTQDRRLTIDEKQGMSRTKFLGFLSRSCVPGLFRDASFENFHPSNDRAKKLCVAMDKFATDFHVIRSQGRLRGFIFIGDPGTGKTHIACAIINNLLMQGIESRYTSLPAITNEFRNAIKDPTLSVSQIIEDLASPEFLVLDEIDLHGATTTDYQNLYDIINRRYENGLITLAISNRPISDLNQDLNERIISRILCGTQPILFEWPSYRDKMQQAGKKDLSI